MSEIMDTINTMIGMTIHIDQGNYSQQIKDESKRTLFSAIDFLHNETSPQKINQLVVNEYRKKQNT